MDNYIVEVGSCKVTDVPQKLIHHSLECGRSTMETKRHYPELEQAEGSREGSLCAGLLAYGDLPVASRKIEGGDVLGLPQPVTRSSILGIGYASTGVTALRRL